MQYNKELTDTQLYELWEKLRNGDIFDPYLCLEIISRIMKERSDKEKQSSSND